MECSGRGVQLDRGAEEEDITNFPMTCRECGQAAPPTGVFPTFSGEVDVSDRAATGNQGG